MASSAAIDFSSNIQSVVLTLEDTLEDVTKKSQCDVGKLKNAVLALRDILVALDQDNERPPSDAPRKQKTSITSLWKTLLLTSKSQHAYRVVFHDSWTSFSEHSGLQAPIVTHSFSDDNLREFVECHIDWNSGMVSPFISLFLDRDHAKKWGHKGLGKHGRTTFELVTVDLGLVQDVYSMRMLVETLSIATRLRPEQYAGEVLVLHRVAPRAVIDRAKWPPTVDPGTSYFTRTRARILIQCAVGTEDELVEQFTATMSRV